MGQSTIDDTHDGLITKQSRDTFTQTSISFPPILPKEVEDVLKKYRFINTEDSQADDETLDSSQCSRSMMDVSTLRRKLFMIRPQTPSDDYELFDSQKVQLSPAPRSPQVLCNSSELKGNSFGAGDDSFGSDMFGELSPINKPRTPTIASSNDVSMLSDLGHEKTPARGHRRQRKGKNLSESFMLQDEFKENIEDLLPVTDNAKRFGRFDSGFSVDDDSKFLTESQFSMQFW